MKYNEITSPSNQLIKEAVKIKGRRGKELHDLFLIEGPHLIEMAYGSPVIKVERVFFTNDFSGTKAGRGLLKHLETAQAHLIEVPENILSKFTDTETPQGIVAVVSYGQARLDELSFKDVPLIIVCDGIQDPGNLGTIIRTSDAAGADAVIILPGSCDAFNPKAVRATAGSLFNIPVIHSNSSALECYLDSKGIALYVTDAHSAVSVYDADLERPMAIVFGNEAHGANKALLKKADRVIKIPIIGRAESLNVATAASVCLYEAVRQRKFRQD